jgi:hypothetical protein
METVEMTAAEVAGIFKSMPREMALELVGEVLTAEQSVKYGVEAGDIVDRFVGSCYMGEISWRDAGDLDTDDRYLMVNSEAYSLIQKTWAGQRLLRSRRVFLIKDNNAAARLWILSDYAFNGKKALKNVEGVPVEVQNGPRRVFLDIIGKNVAAFSVTR